MSLQWSGEQVVAKFPDVQVRTQASTLFKTIMLFLISVDTWLIEKKILMPIESYLNRTKRGIVKCPLKRHFNKINVPS